MKVRINSIPLSHAKPGMTAGKSVFNQLGQVLIQEGVALSGALLLSLERRNISHIHVLFEDPRTEKELSAEREKVVARLNILFRHVGNDSSLELLRLTVLDYRLRKLL